MRRAWLFALCFAAMPARAATPEAGTWLTQDRSSVIAIQDCATGLCGRIVGISLDHPTDAAPKDIWGHSQCGEAIIDMPRHGDDGRWHGTILDPRSGRRWSAQIWHVDDAQGVPILRLRGYLGLPLFGATQAWTTWHGHPGANCAFTPEPAPEPQLNLAPVIELRVLDPRLHDWGLPAHQTDMAAAIDLHACLDAPLALAPGTPAILIPAGLSILIGDPTITALIVPRSGMGHRQGLILGNSVGVIDADYAGPIMISAWNRNPPGTAPILIEPGARIAQMLFVPVLRPVFTLTDSFTTTTARGSGGFGSTG